MKLCFGLAIAFLSAVSIYGAPGENILNRGKVLQSIEEGNRNDITSGDNDDVTVLSEIIHYTKQGDAIDISISKEAYTETCLIQSPNADLTPAELLTLDGVTVQHASEFVSCRITIVMTSDSIGDWKLCGLSNDGDMRCQPVKIMWHNTAHPPTNWGSNARIKVDHPVHYGGVVNTGIASPSSSLVTCHVITPNDEDLVIKSDMSYPHIIRTETNNPTLCAAVFSINAAMIGDWVIYGRFRTGSTQNDIRLPMNFYLYNEQKPYEQAYNITEQIETNNEVVLGDTFTEKLSGSGKVTECIYTMPSGERSTLLSSAPNEEVILNSIETEVACQLTINSITEDMLGVWQFIAKFNDENQFNEKQHLFNLIKKDLTPETVSAESEESVEEEGVESEDDNINFLTEINHFTRREAKIDISLNKESFEENCYVRAPGAQMVAADDFNMEGVEVQPKSKFVSCRVTIAPITQELLGEWRLCGKSVINDEMRCQTANIAWNSGDGIALWDSITRPRFDHPVHVGGFVNPGVSGSGQVRTCHIVTPAGEDLVITSDVHYPHIERSTWENPSLCSVVIKDVTRDLLGDWIIYGRFQAPLGQNEVRLPMSFFLYDENNPYDQAYNVTILGDHQQLVNIGTDLILQVNQATGVVEDCVYTTPSGQTFNLNDQLSNAFEGVSFKSSDSGAICQIILDPITDAITGEWQITGKFRNGVLYDERRQSFRVIKEDPANPIADDIERNVQILSPETLITNMNAIHRIIITGNTFIENESCHIITPDGLQYAFIPGFPVPDVEIINESGVECGLRLNIARYDMIGEWTLIARANWLSVPTERRRTFTVRVEENFIIQNDITISNGADLYLHLHKSIDNPETCKLYGPDGNEYKESETDPLYSSSCGYIVRNAERNHNGRWIIEYGPNIKYKGSVDVVVLDSKEINIDNLHWTTGDSIDISLGPEDAVYCKIDDANGRTLFDDFGQCKIVLHRVTLEHRGTWKMFIAVPGTVLMQEYGFYVDVQTRGTFATLQKNKGDGSFQ